MGDFNCEPNSEPINGIKGYLNDIFIENLLLENKNNTLNFNSNIKNTG